MNTLKRQLGKILDCQPLWRLAWLVSAAAILFLATTSEPYPMPSSANDKVNHLLAFAELTILARLAWPQVRIAALALVVLGFGLMIEAIQFLLPHRDFSLLDLAADAAGIGLGLLPWPGLSRKTTNVTKATQS